MRTGTGVLGIQGELRGRGQLFVADRSREGITGRIFAGISSGGGLAVALRLAQQLENAVIVSIICDRGDRYLSTGVFPA